MSWPSISMEPAVGSSNPASMRNSVDFPEPDPPSRQNSSPLKMSSDTRDTAAASPNFLVTSRMRTKGFAAASRQGRVSAAMAGFLAISLQKKDGRIAGSVAAIRLQGLLPGLHPGEAAGQEFVILGAVGVEREQLRRH